uniref:GntR family transcriptional regulator n=1 Tax=biofilter metagenome TaxID=1070537 RepID=A0A1A7GDW7_9ZZZZ
MRPAGEIRQALLDAARTLVTADWAPTQRELAEHAGVSYDAARGTVRDMVRAKALRVVRTRRVAYRNKPVAEYVPVDKGAAIERVELDSVMQSWAALA